MMLRGWNLLWHVSVTLRLQLQLLLLLVLVGSGASEAGALDVLTSRNDGARTGAMPHERILTPDRVSQQRSPGNFGKLFQFDLNAIGGQASGEIYAQPLYVNRVNVPGHGLVNLVLVATMSNLVVALDADGARAGSDGVLWKRTLGVAPRMDEAVWENCNQSPCLAPIGHNVLGTAGIGSTPVIDRARHVVFVLNRELTGNGIEVTYHLHALDLGDGRDLPGSPVAVAGHSFSAIFNPNLQNQRAGLAQSGQQIVIGFGAYEDLMGYRGWLFSYRYDPFTGFTQTGAMTTTPDGDTSASCAHFELSAAASQADFLLNIAATKVKVDRQGGDPAPGSPRAAALAADQAALDAAQAMYDRLAGPDALQAANHCAHGGIWMTGRAPAVADDGRILLQVGNGHNDLGQAPNRNFGNSLISLDPVSLQVLDAFTPANHLALNRWDLDLGGSGPMLVPGTALVVGGGKQGIMHVWNLDHLGGFRSDDAGVLQKFTPGIVEAHFDTGLDNPGGVIDVLHLSDSLFNLNLHAGHIMGGPVLWQRPRSAGGSRLYHWSEDSELREYAFDESSSTPVQLPELAKSSYVQPGHPGGILSLSSDGITPGSGIVWAITYQAEEGTTGALTKVLPGVLRAYVADNLEPLWTSEDQPGADRLGKYAKFVPPTVANGRVYMVNFDGQLVAYGLRNHVYRRPASTVMEVVNAVLSDE